MVCFLLRNDTHIRLNNMSNGKILLVEDDPLMINLYRKVFEKHDFEVKVAERGQAGLDLIKEFLPDLLLLDVMMPEMDGFEVLKKIKADEATKNITVVMLSNLAGTEDASRAIQMGALKYLIKSEHDPNEIVEIAKQVMETKK